ncbi:hypothetical protein [uncultured Jatrophihabitans sp.]|uniref:hypothetical protein n=1 Tax=uncultured Jatrophihabitans sp. TaxID=1610747 RepID=UPI0035CB8E7B
MIASRLGRRDGDESGFALVFVLLVTAMAMIGLATTFSVAAPNIIASKKSQDVAAALLAAQSGINDAVAYLTNVPACRSETRICPQALGADSASLNRPSLGTAQTFHWTTATSVTADQDVRLTSTGTEDGVNRTLIADLSLNPSILRYGYYTDYESQSPTFFDNYFTQRNIDITDSSVYGQTNYSGSVPQVASWNGAKAAVTYPDSVCGQHYYSDSATLKGRASVGSTWQETGTVNGSATTHTGQCELVFTTGMVANGPTYTRDALLVSDLGGNGPLFKSPVDTLWGYPGHDSPAPSNNLYYRQNEKGATVDPSGQSPELATQDITLPTTIGTDGVETNSCVYYGPTRVVLNGDGTATVTSPATKSKASGADTGCYPNDVSKGVAGWTYNYTTTGSGTIYAKNLNTPSSGTWPQSTLTTATSPSASNEIFYLPATGGTAADPSPSAHNHSTSALSSGCSGSTKYAATANAKCAWTGVTTATDATSATGWTADSRGSQKCSALTNWADRATFECDYGNLSSTATPSASTNGYGTLRSKIQSDIAASTCLSGDASSQATCLDTLVTNDLSSQTTTTSRYVATATAGTPVVTNTTVGATPTSAVSGDSLFSPLSAANETQTVTPVTVTVYHETKSRSTWGSDVAQFTLTSTQTNWNFTPASTASMFPNPKDVTQYAIGATSAGAAAGSSGTSQPGDLYVQGVNQGTLSLIAQNNVEITGDVTKGSGNDSSSSNPVSITAGNDVRNYHPVYCADQATADITQTTAGFCPNDLTGLTSNGVVSGNGTFYSWAPQAQYTNMIASGNRTIDAAVFTLTGSLRTDNYDRGTLVGNLTVNGGIYQSHRGANGVQNSSGGNVARTGTVLQYNYVDLQRGNLQYVPSARYSTNPRVWNIVSISAGS